MNLKSLNILVPISVCAVIFGGFFWWWNRDIPTGGDAVVAKYADVPAEAYVGADIRMMTIAEVPGNSWDGEAHTYAYLNINADYLFENKVLEILSKKPDGHFVANELNLDNQHRYRVEVECDNHQATVHLIVQNQETRTLKQLVVSSYCD